MNLFATVAIGEVTVQDIADAVDMTPAAVYYHFASKEQILTEGMMRFRDELLDEIKSALPEAGDPAGIRSLVSSVLAWAAKQRSPATVYFVSSIGLNMTAEAVRRETRVEMIDLACQAVKTVRGTMKGPEAAVVAVTLVSLLETSMASMLSRDAGFRKLGARRFNTEVAAIGDRIAGVAS